MYLEKWRKSSIRTLTAILILTLVFALYPMTSLTDSDSGSAYAAGYSPAANGTGFQKVADGVGIVFTGGNSTTCSGFKGTYLTLSKTDLSDVADNLKANTALGTGNVDNLYLDNVLYSGFRKGTMNYVTVSGINLAAMTSPMGISKGSTGFIYTKSTDNYTGQITNPFNTRRAFFSQGGTTQSAVVDPAVSLTDTDSSAIPRVLFGQTSEGDPNMQNWGKNVNMIHFGQKTDSLALNNNGEVKNYMLGDIIRSTAGQYKATFSYNNTASKNVTANVTGIPLTEYLKAEGLNPHELKISVTTSSKNVELTKSEFAKYFIAYDGNESVDSGTATNISNNTDLQVYGPGTTEAQVCIRDVTGLSLTAAAPDAPAKVTATKKSYNSINISWTPVSTAANYYVFRYNSMTKKYDEIHDTYNGGSKTSFTDTKLKTGQKYTYKVKAYRVLKNVELISDYSMSASAKPTLDKTTLKSVKKNGKKAVSIKWKKVSGANGYVVYKAIKKNGKYKKVATIKKGSKTTYKDKKVKKNKKYYYKVKAYRTVNGKKVYGSFSTKKYVKR